MRKICNSCHYVQIIQHVTYVEAMRHLVASLRFRLYVSLYSRRFIVLLYNKSYIFNSIKPSLKELTNFLPFTLPYIWSFVNSSSY